MRFFYRIFTPMKVRPIKIINTTLSTGGKQLQIVPVKSSSDHFKQIDSDKPKEDKSDSKPDPLPIVFDQSEDHKKELFAHLQLQSKSQIVQEKKVSNDVPVKSQPKDCIFEYEEPEEEFAEKRDREWAMQKKLDESRKQQDDYCTHHFSKKRKKNKHSKNESNQHKKRKLHAEIASNDDAELKLKVKITNNGHKHKHHKSSGQNIDKSQSSEISSKEKLLQMRQIRHKHVASEDKNIQTVPSIKLSTIGEAKDTVKIDKSTEKKQEIPKTVGKPLEDIKKLKIKVTEPSSQVSESAILPKQQSDVVNTSPKVGTFPEPSSSKTTATVKPTVEKEWKTVDTTHDNKEPTEKQTQKPFSKSINTEKIQKIERLQQTKIDDIKIKPLTNTSKPHFKADIRTDSKLKTTNKLLERQIASLQQQCTIEPKQPDIDKRKPVPKEKPKFLTPPGFTVSKVEQGMKRKAEDDDSINDKRPSLEITLINPPNPSPGLQITKCSEKPIAKRPPPATIPLDKIKKSVHLKSAGISIIPKMANEKCDNIGALDLSKPTNKQVEITTKTSTSNGFSISTNRQLNALAKPMNNSPNEKSNISLSNLHMLSKVATEHSTLNKSSSNSTVHKPRPQIPNLQTIKIPSPQNQVTHKVGNSTPPKMPKLNELKFRPNMPIRSVRPNQNQNIRNIPNPSLLIRQQNQNRLNSQIGSQQLNNTEQSTKTSNVVATTASQPIAKETVTTLKIMESKVQEKKEISV